MTSSLKISSSKGVLAFGRIFFDNPFCDTPFFTKNNEQLTIAPKRANPVEDYFDRRRLGSSSWRRRSPSRNLNPNPNPNPNPNRKPKPNRALPFDGRMPMSARRSTRHTASTCSKRCLPSRASMNRPAIPVPTFAVYTPTAIAVRVPTVLASCPGQKSRTQRPPRLSFQRA